VEDGEFLAHKPELLTKLHDAVLHTVQLDWQNGSIRLELHAFVNAGEPAVPVVLRAEQVTLFSCPRQNAWGPSKYVNAARTRSLDAGRTRLELELQSGDVLELEADAVTAEIVS
jgi:hypothetical protein